LGNSQMLLECRESLAGEGGSGAGFFRLMLKFFDVLPVGLHRPFCELPIELGT
jgi:hypothetical protein